MIALICELCAFRGEIRWDASRPTASPGAVSIPAGPRRLSVFGPPRARDGLAETIAWYEKHRVDPADATETAEVDTPRPAAVSG